jgi:hypothetical protein
MLVLPIALDLQSTGRCIILPPSSSTSSLAASSTSNKFQSTLSVNQIGSSQTPGSSSAQKSHGIHTSGAIGIGVGIGLAICFLVALFLSLRQRSAAKKNYSNMAEMPTDEIWKGSTKTEGKSDVSSVTVQEVLANAVARHEMYVAPAEMLGDSVFIEEPGHAASPKLPSTS